MFARVLAKEF